MNRLGWISTLVGFAVGLLLWTAPPVQAECNSNIRATTPTSDFSLNDSNGTAIHLKTGLTWMRCALGQCWNSTLKTCTGNPTPYTWGEALRAARGASFAGYSDWRLPNAKELLSIVEDRCYVPSINETVFPEVSSYWYWSSSTYAAAFRPTRGTSSSTAAACTPALRAMAPLRGSCAADSGLAILWVAGVAAVR